MKVAICYDWLDSFGGAERLVKVLAEIFPDGEIFSLVKSDEAMWWSEKRVHVSWLNYGLLKRRLSLALLGGLGWLAFDLSRFDLVISVSSDQAKWIRHKRHINICLTPARHWWGRYQEMTCDLALLPVIRIFLKLFGIMFRLMDFYRARKVKYMVAISEEVRIRIKRYYGLQVDVVHPPVEVLRYN